MTRGHRCRGATRRLRRSDRSPRWPPRTPRTSPPVRPRIPRRTDSQACSRSRTTSNPRRNAIPTPSTTQQEMEQPESTAAVDFRSAAAGEARSQPLPLMASVEPNENSCRRLGRRDVCRIVRTAEPRRRRSRRCDRPAAVSVAQSAVAANGIVSRAGGTRAKRSPARPPQGVTSSELGCPGAPCAHVCPCFRRAAIETLLVLPR